MPNNAFPSFFTFTDCPNKFASVEKYRYSLPKTLSSNFKEVALDELFVFYIAITRAKKQVFVSASATRLDSFGNEKNSIFSCMVSMCGIKMIKAPFAEDT
jgi:DNA helicase-2/ATP-dependent DNA helicase PcrA